MLGIKDNDDDNIYFKILYINTYIASHGIMSNIYYTYNK